MYTSPPVIAALKLGIASNCVTSPIQVVGVANTETAAVAGALVVAATVAGLVIATEAVAGALTVTDVTNGDPMDAAAVIVPSIAVDVVTVSRLESW